MGNGGAKPSAYLKKQWIDDGDSTQCYNCCLEFTPFRRRHHCRCCGEIFCGECWGDLVELPPDYGYPEPVPVCHNCGMLFNGKLRFLRGPRRVVMTRSLRSNKRAEKPPLCEANLAAGAFEVFFMKVAHWRPLNLNTHLQFSVTLRTATGSNSSRHNKEDRRRVVPKCSTLDYDDEPVIKRATGNEVQLDVAWTLALEALLQVALDHHAESDYITLETAQESYRIQVATTEGPMNAEQTIADQKSNDEVVETQKFSVTKNASKAKREAAPTGNSISPPSPNSASTRTSPRVPANVLLQGGSANNRRRPSGSAGTLSRDSSSEAVEDRDHTSKPEKGAAFTVDPVATSELFLELQDAVRMVRERQAKVEAHRRQTAK